MRRNPRGGDSGGKRTTSVGDDGTQQAEGSGVSDCAPGRRREAEGQTTGPGSKRQRRGDEGHTKEAVALGEKGGGGNGGAATCVQTMGEPLPPHVQGRRQLWREPHREARDYDGRRGCHDDRACFDDQASAPHRLDHDVDARGFSGDRAQPCGELGRDGRPGSSNDHLRVQLRSGSLMRRDAPSRDGEHSEGSNCRGGRGLLQRASTQLPVLLLDLAMLDHHMAERAADHSVGRLRLRLQRGGNWRIGPAPLETTFSQYGCGRHPGFICRARASSVAASTPWTCTGLRRARGGHRLRA